MKKLFICVSAVFIMGPGLAQGRKPGTAKDKTLVEDGTTLYAAEFSRGIPRDFVNMGAWIRTPLGVKPTATGLNNYLMLNRQYAVNDRKASIRVNLGKDSRLDFFSMEIDHYHRWGTCIQVDAKDSLLKIFKAYNVDERSLPDLLNDHPYPFVPGRDYEISMLNEPTRNLFIIVDGLTGSCDTTILPRLSSGLIRDVFAFAAESGAPPLVKSMRISTRFKKGRRVLFIGDSITEGFSSSPGTFSQNGRSIISGRSAGIIVGVQNRVLSEISVLRPRYVSILIGTNGFNTVENLTSLCQSIMKLGITPILNNIPWKAPASVVGENADIARVRKKLNLRGAAFDRATSIDGLNIRQDTSLFNKDGVHPNALGMQKMFEQFRKDVPGIF